MIELVDNRKRRTGIKAENKHNRNKQRNKQFNDKRSSAFILVFIAFLFCRAILLRRSLL